jgi:ribosomal protein S18 acetylase RimI-like enzyme
MDTWASNDTLIEYYGRLGFQVVGRRRIAPDPRLAAHYHGIELALLEKPCPSGVRVE